MLMKVTIIEVLHCIESQIQLLTELLRILSSCSYELSFLYVLLNIVLGNVTNILNMLRILMRPVFCVIYIFFNIL